MIAHFRISQRLSFVLDLWEEAVMTILALVIVVLTGMSLCHLVSELWTSMWAYGIEIDRPEVLQVIFGSFFTVLIAIEFRHSFLTSGSNGQTGSIAHVGPVLLIGILATVRHFLMLDITKASSGDIISMATIIVALSVAYWVIGRTGARMITKPVSGDHSHTDRIPE